MPTDETSARSPGLLGHLLACIAGASLDNIFRVIVVVTLAAVAKRTTADDEAAATATEQLTGLVMILFILPFVLLAPTAGSLGDRWPKHWIIRLCRLGDVVCIGLGLLAVEFQSTPLLLLAITSFAVVSAFFAPVKLAVMPELVEPKRLTSANAILAAATVLAILAGTAMSATKDPLTYQILGMDLGSGDAGSGATLPVVAAIAGLFCVVGIIGAFLVPALKPLDPTRPIAGPWNMLRELRWVHGSGLGVPAWSLAMFWAVGTVAMIGVSAIVTDRWQLNECAVASLMLMLSIGLISGSLLAPRLIHPANPAGLPVIGALITGIGLMGAGWSVLGSVPPSGDEVTRLIDAMRTVGPWMALCGFGGGLWEVPVTVLLQERASPEHRNQVMAGVTILSNVATVVLVGLMMVVTGGIGEKVAGHPLHYQHAWVLLGAITVAACLGFLVVYRLQVARWVIAVTTRLWWGGRLSGVEHLPRTGGCLLVCNHLSFADGLALIALLPRRPRFLVYRAYFKMPIVGFFLRAGGCIPVAAEDSRRALLAAIDSAVEAAKAGELVAIFPEGKLTRSGTTDRFRGGLERIASRSGVPVVPAWLSGFWGSAWSKDKHWKVLHLERARLRLGAPLPSTVRAAEARAAVIALSHAEATAEAGRDPRSLGEAALALARRHPFAGCVRDAQGQLSAWKTMAIARSLVPLLALASDERRVGVVLPPGRAGTLVNLALAIDGRVAVNLNHTVGQAQLERMCAIAGIRTVVTAGLYLRKIGDPVLPGRQVRVEDLLPRLGKLRLLGTALVNLLLPAAWLAKPSADDVATIIFSSGSTGDPKGVQLTHRQILANCRGVVRALDLKPYEDVLCSPLPLFHSFGLVPGMWLGLTDGITIAAHPDPRDGEAIGKLIAASKATFTISTPSFVRGWMRRIEPDQLRTLRFAMVGAERCPAELKRQFRDRYGADLLEGYGCTELAPVVAVNLPDVKRDGEHEVRNRDGSVGRPAPGIEIFAVDPVTNEVLAEGSEGLLVVRSPARMLGYLERDDLTAKAFIHGGYNTGDMGRVDEDGFIHITGRLARFAKIAGEMVPLDNVEAALDLAFRAAEPDSTAELAVASISDEARGERLVVLHTGVTTPADQLLAKLDTVPALWRPRAADFKAVTEIPKLGTGKRDLAALKRLAASAMA